jgi:hypothetical protein
MAEFEGTDWHCDWMLTAEHSSEHKVLITWLDRIGALIGMFTIKTDLVVANHQLMGLHGHAITAEVKAGALVAKVLGISKK